jgi:hypothetical protein
MCSARECQMSDVRRLTLRLIHAQGESRLPGTAVIGSKIKGAVTPDCVGPAGCRLSERTYGETGRNIAQYPEYEVEKVQ